MPRPVKLGTRTVDFVESDDAAGPEVIAPMPSSSGLDAAATRARLEADGYLYLPGLIPRAAVLTARAHVLESLAHENTPSVLLSDVTAVLAEAEEADGGGVAQIMEERAAKQAEVAELRRRLKEKEERERADAQAKRLADRRLGSAALRRTRRADAAAPAPPQLMNSWPPRGGRSRRRAAGGSGW